MWELLKRRLDQGMGVAFAFESEVDATERDAWWARAVREGLHPSTLSGYPDPSTWYVLRDPAHPYQGELVAAMTMFLRQRAMGVPLTPDELHLKCLREWMDTPPS